MMSDIELERLLEEIEESNNRIKQEKIKAIEEEIKTKNITIPKTNDQFMKEFKNSITRYMHYGVNPDSPDWKRIKKDKFCLRFNAYSGKNGYFIVEQEYLEELIRDFFDYYKTNPLYYGSNELDKIFKDILNNRFDEILKATVSLYVDYIYMWVEDGLFDDNLPTIEQELLEDKTRILEETARLPIHKFVSENYSILIKLITDEINNDWRINNYQII